MSGPPEQPQWFRDYQASQIVQKNQEAILGRIDGLQDTLNKIIIAIAAVGGSDVGLKFVHSTPEQIGVAAIGGFLLVFSFGTLLYRFGRLPLVFKILMGMNTVIGVSVLGMLAVAIPLFGLITSMVLIVLLFFLTFISWNVDRYLVVKK